MLASSTPGAETRVGHLPQQLQLVFNDKIMDTQVTLTGPDAGTVTLGAVTVRNETARIALGVPDGAPGSYTVSYTATGAGGTVSNGSFSFTVTTGVKSSASAKPGRTPTSQPAAPATSAAAAPADFVTSNGQPPAAADEPTPAGRPAWWTYAAVLLVVACVLVVFLGFSRRRIRPANPAK